MLMRSIQVTVLVMAMVLCVIAVFVAPGVDLPKSALRSQQAANALFSTVVTAAIDLYGLEPPSPSAFVPLPHAAADRANGRDLVTSNCTLIC